MPMSGPEKSTCRLAGARSIRRRHSVSGLAVAGALPGLWFAAAALPCKHTPAKVARLVA